ncbi:uncharacterized protein [Engystomops pustulosus]|uniref:uncharacterized protein n=1 Tax=Engystomops pustulosus TaxID=76066 RepID=UPI003AFA0DB8
MDKGCTDTRILSAIPETERYKLIDHKPEAPQRLHHLQKIPDGVILSPGGSTLHFQFCAPPFGMYSTPRAFTKVMVEVVAFLLQRDVLIVRDDLLIIGKDKENLISSRNFTIETLENLGKGCTYQEANNKVQEKIRDLNQRSHEGLGILDGKHSFSGLVPGPILNPSEVDPEVLQQETRRSRRKDPDSSCGKRRSSMTCLLQEGTISAITIFAKKRGEQAKSRRVLSFLECSPSLCLPPYSPDRQSPGKDKSGENENYIHLSDLAEEKLVPAIEKDVTAGSSNSPAVTGPVVTGSDTSSEPGKVTAFSLDPESSYLRSQGLSSKVIRTLKVLDFLQKGLELGLSTSTLKVQVSALSAFFDQPLIKHRNQEIILPSCENLSSEREHEWNSLDGKNKGRKVSKATIARWLKTAISLCYEIQKTPVPTGI